MGNTPIAVGNTIPGGTQNALDVTAAAVIKASPGTIMRIVTITAGSAGNLTVNDNILTGASNVTANEVASIPFGNANAAAGAVWLLEFPCKNGIVISAVPTGWAGSVSFI